MEPSQYIGGPEECSSNESGWTMYIDSPMHGRDADDDDDDDDAGGVIDDNLVDDASGDDDAHGDDDPSSSHGSSSSDDEADDSDDSMASDASSGPGHNENSYGYTGRYCAGKVENVEDKDDEKENGRKGCAYKKIYKGKKTETMKKKKKGVN